MPFKTQIKEVGGFWSMLLILMTAVAFYSLFYTWTVWASESAFSMWILGLVIFVSNFSETIKIKRGKAQENYASLTLILSLIPSYFQYKNLTYLMVSFGIVLFFCGIKALKNLFTPLFIWLIAIPYYAPINLQISYPMRLLETHIANLILQLLNYNSTALASSIFIDGKEIIITTACSGIEHLWILILFAWLGSMFLFKQRLVKGVYFLCIIPIFIMCNAIRVVITIICTDKLGDAFLTGTPHFLFGLITIILTLLGYIFLGKLLSKLEVDEVK